MKNESIKIFQKKKKSILETWMKYQLADEGLREDLMSNEDLRTQSEELLNIFVDNLKDENIGDPGNRDFESVIDILSGISISRAKQGYSPRETGVFVFSLKDALLNVGVAEYFVDTVDIGIRNKYLPESMIRNQANEMRYAVMI